MSDYDDDEPSWWQKLTLPNAIIISVVLILLFGGFRCSIEFKSAPAPATATSPGSTP